jgi:hypothetical protein
MISWSPVRYPASFNDFAVHCDFEAYRQRLITARDTFAGVYEQVKDKVESALRWAASLCAWNKRSWISPGQQMQLKKAVEITKNIPANLPELDANAWTNTWHWVLSW